MLSPQFVSEAKGVPQSMAQLHGSSSAEHWSSPHRLPPVKGVTSLIGEAGKPLELIRLLAAGLVLNAYLTANVLMDLTVIQKFQNVSP